MPNQRSAAKRMRSDAKKRLLNQVAVSELKTRYRKLVTEAKANPEVAREHGRILMSKLDKAVSRGIIPHRRADRKKALIARLLGKSAASN